MCIDRNTQKKIFGKERLAGYRGFVAGLFKALIVRYTDAKT
jgi:hypothetical protein